MPDRPFTAFPTSSEESQRRSSVARRHIRLLRRLGLVVGSSHAGGRQPRRVRRSALGGCHGACAVCGHDSNQQQALVSARSNPRRARSVHARIVDAYRATPLAANSRPSLGVLFRRQVRDAALKRAGHRIVRLEASLVVSDIEQVLCVIRAALT